MTPSQQIAEETHSRMRRAFLDQSIADVSDNSAYLKAVEMGQHYPEQGYDPDGYCGRCGVRMVWRESDECEGNVSEGH